MKSLEVIDPDVTNSLNVAVIEDEVETPVELLGGPTAMTVGPTVENDQVTVLFPTNSLSPSMMAV